LPAGALLAPLLAGVLETSLGLEAGALAAGTLGGGLLAGGLGAATGAVESEITGGKPLTGAITGGVTSGLTSGVGPLVGEALGTSATAGEALVGGAAGAGTAALTGGNPLIGGIGGAVSPLAGAALSGSSGAPAAPTANIVSAPTASGAAGPAAIGGSVGASTAAATSPIPLDPTAGGGAGPSGGGVAPSGGGISGGTGVASDPNTFFLPTGTTPTGGDTFSASGFTPLAGTGGTIDAGGGGLQALIDKFSSNPAMLLQAAPLAMALFGGGQSPYPAEKSLQTLATNAGTQGQALSGYIQSGTLPPGAQANVDAAKAAAKAGIRSADARLGLSDSTMKAQQLAQVDQQAAGQQFLLANMLLGQGMNAEQIAAGDYKATLTAEMSRDQALQTAILNAARGLGGGSAGWQQPTTAVA
jgi:hypothetical protein